MNKFGYLVVFVLILKNFANALNCTTGVRSESGGVVANVQVTSECPADYDTCQRLDITATLGGEESKYQNICKSLLLFFILAKRL